tara:strand:- start:472 stop:702 length:231 start_codon:yes stop_codon:yes gene_type:complete
MSRGYKAEVLLAGGEWGQNGIVWPDRASAEEAARDLWSRWTLTTDHRAVEVDEPPNRPTWDEHVAAHGLPPRSVRL